MITRCSPALHNKQVHLMPPTDGLSRCEGHCNGVTSALPNVMASSGVQIRPRFDSSRPVYLPDRYVPATLRLAYRCTSLRQGVACTWHLSIEQNGVTVGKRRASFFRSLTSRGFSADKGTVDGPYAHRLNVHVGASKSMRMRCWLISLDAHIRISGLRTSPLTVLGG